MGIDWQAARGEELTQAEREWLFGQAFHYGQAKPHPTFVHLGLGFGASALCTKAGCPDARVVGIDLDAARYEGDPALVEVVKGNSHELDWTGPVDLLFVDAGHEAEDVHADICHWVQWVRPGSVIAFHDYEQPEFPHVEGVRQAVDGWDWAPTTWERIDAPDSLRAYRRRPWLRVGDTFGTIGIGVPYYKSEYPFFQWWSALLTGGLENGDQMLNDDRFHECPMPMPVAHNALVRRFLETDRDTLCILEDDHCGPQDTIRRMRFKPDNLGYDAVCANYVNRRSFPIPIGWSFSGPPEKGGELTLTIDMSETPTTGTQQVDGSAVGCVLIRRWVLEAILGDTPPQKGQWFEIRGRNSLDIWFYYHAREVGARCAVDRDAQIGHVAQEVRWFSDFVTERARLMDRAKQTSEG